MIKVNCMRCMNELTEPGAVIMSPPMKHYHDEVKKMHLCIECYSLFIHQFLGIIR